MLAEQSGRCPYHEDQEASRESQTVEDAKRIPVTELLPLSIPAHAAKVFPELTDHMKPHVALKALAIRNENREKNRVIFPDGERARTSSFTAEQRVYVSALAATWTAALQDSLAETVVAKLSARNGTLLKTKEFQVIFVDSVFEVLLGVIEDSPTLLYPLKAVIMEMAEASGLREITDRIDFFRLRRDVQNGYVPELWSAEFGDVYEDQAFWDNKRERLVDEKTGESKEYRFKVRCPFQPVTKVAGEEFLVALQVVAESVASGEVTFEIDEEEFLHGTGRTTSRMKEKAKNRSSNKVTDWELRFLNMPLVKPEEDECTRGEI